MACMDAKTYGAITVWTKKSDSLWLFHALAAPESTVGYEAVRGSLENRSSSGATKTRISYRLSNDGVTWGTPLALYRSPNSPQEQINDGTAYGALFVNLAPDLQDKQWILWGVEAVNSTGSGLEMASCVVKLDRKG
jgi:hypothetical protein